MKTRLWVPLLCVMMLSITSCANQNKSSVHGLAPTKKVDRNVVLSQVVKKAQASSYEELVAMNDFHDNFLRVKHAQGKKIVVLAVEQNKFPFFLEYVMRSNDLLNSLPRNKEWFTFVESKRAPGVINVYYKVHAKYIPEGKQHPLEWMPSKEIWAKFVQEKSNLLEEKKPQHIFLTLFYMGNIDFNPELIIAVQGTDNKWDWNRMPHPSKTGLRQTMLVPIATVQNSAMFDLLK